MIDDDDLLIDEAHDAVHEDGEEEDLLAGVDTPDAAAAWNWGEPESDETAPPIPRSPGTLPSANGSKTIPVMPAVPAPRGAPALFTPPVAPSAPTLSQELDAFLAPDDVAPPPPRPRTPAPPPPPPRNELEDLLDGPSEPLPAAPAGARGASVLTPAMPIPVADVGSVAPDAGRGVEILVVDPQSMHADSPIEVALKRMGFAPNVVETGGAARDELNRAQPPLVFLRVAGDAGWARMLVLTAQQRWPDVRFMASVQRGGAGLTQQLIECGVADVVEEPLPGDATLLFHIQAIIPELLPSAAHSQAMMDDMQELRARLTRAVAESEARAQEMAARAQEAEQRLQSLNKENTRQRSEISNVKSELGVLRERAGALESNLTKAHAELSALKTRNAELEAAAKKGAAGVAAPAPSTGAPGELNVQEVKTLLAALHPYGFAMDQAIEFLLALSKEPGSHPDLGRHVKNLQLARGVLKRLQARVG